MKIDRYAIPLCIIIAIGIVFSFSTYKRNVLWGDEYRLWLDNVAKAPSKADAHNNLGIAYGINGRLDKAMEEIQTALLLKPLFSEAHSNLGIVYAMQGQLDEAIKEFSVALRQNPENINARHNVKNAIKLKKLTSYEARKGQAQ